MSTQTERPQGAGPYFIVEPAQRPEGGFVHRNIGEPQSWIVTPDQTCRWYADLETAEARAAEFNAAESTSLAAQSAAAAHEMARVLDQVVSYLADLNGSDWIKGDHPAQADMRQRAKALHILAFNALSAAKGKGGTA